MTRFVRVALALVALLGCMAEGGAAQGVDSRTPNLSGGWTAPPGAGRFHFTHRFWTVTVFDETKLNASPTFLLAFPTPGRTMVGAQFASNSLVVAGEFNEWEAFARWSAPLISGSFEVAVTGVYNGAAKSGDGELSLRWPVPSTPVQLLGAARVFADALGTGEFGWYAGGGILLDVAGVTLAADAGRLDSDGVDAEMAWGIGLQIPIAATPHSLSIHATNTRTATLQGSSVGSGTVPGPFGGKRTFWGFEFTVPLTYARIFPWL